MGGNGRNVCGSFARSALCRSFSMLSPNRYCCCCCLTYEFRKFCCCSRCCGYFIVCHFAKCVSLKQKGKCHLYFSVHLLIWIMHFTFKCSSRKCIVFCATQQDFWKNEFVANSSKKKTRWNWVECVFALQMLPANEYMAISHFSINCMNFQMRTY